MDHFHIIKMLTEMCRFFRNRLKTAISYRKTMEAKMAKAIIAGHSQKYSRPLGLAKSHEKQMSHLSKTIDILVSWMEHDVLNKAGPNLSTRQALYDFIVFEFKKLQQIHPHRIKEVCTTLTNQRNLALAFVDVLDDKFQHIAEQFNCPIDTLWQMCELQRCQFNGINYALRSIPLVDQLKDRFDIIEDAVIESMDHTERTSSMVENLNSRLSSYFFLRRYIGNGYLELLKFYFNHTQFIRSSDPNRAGKTPTEILTQKYHPHWLELLGFQRFKRAA